MSSKIEWYQEVLALEPGSKVFFPLGKLFAETGQLDKAAVTLRQGLDRHPDFLEARLLLIQILVDLGRPDEAAEMIRHIIEPLRQSPAFWSLWAGQMGKSDRDFSVFLMLVASHLGGEPIRWADVVMEGLNSVAERLVGPAHGRPQGAAAVQDKAPTAANHVLDEVYPGDEEDEVAGGEITGFRTLTMADVLAAQGDVDGARGIYEELLTQETEPARRAVLESRMAALGALAAQARPGAEPEDVFSKHAKNRLIGALEALAARFEARVSSAG